MGQRYQHSMGREENIAAILHIYGDSAIFLLFFYHQDTETKS